MKKNIAKLQRVKIFWLEYAKTTASMVIAKEILEVWYLPFLWFFLCIWNKFNKNDERKQTHKRQRKGNNKKISKSKIKIVDDIFYLMKFLINTDENTHPIIIQTIEIYHSKIDYLQLEKCCHF